MPDIADRITEVLHDHRPIHDPHGHINGTVPGSVAVYDCYCGLVNQTTLDDCLAHQRDALVETLGLTPEYSVCADFDGETYLLSSHRYLSPGPAATDLPEHPEMVNPFVGRSYVTRWERDA